MMPDDRSASKGMALHQLPSLGLGAALEPFTPKWKQLCNSTFQRGFLESDLAALTSRAAQNCGTERGSATTAAAATCAGTLICVGFVGRYLIDQFTSRRNHRFKSRAGALGVIVNCLAHGGQMT